MMRNKVVVCLAFVLACAASWQLTVAVRGYATQPTPLPAAEAGAGALRVVDKEGRPRGQCPLEHTDVKAEISGLLARVTVEQKFANPFDEAIEAVYVFPLPHRAAVDRMTMKIGERTIEGKVLERERARELYDAARNAGHTASLLDQQRPNVFVQSVANIPPGQRVDVTISYVETLPYDDGTYKLVFPMVVGPRYNPKSVVDAEKISPPVAPPATRAGHDISIEVNMDAGVPIMDLRSESHAVDVQRTGESTAVVTLADGKTIPNKDFVLAYEVAGDGVEDALFTHRQNGDGFFTLVLQPPDRPEIEEISSRELVFVLDTSGSMSGFPIEKAKETMELAFEALRPGDTFNLITFAGDTHILFPEPVAATPESLARAREFLESRRGGGGTEMMKAIRAALEPSDRQEHVRIVCFMTDGYIGNDMEIIAEVQRHPNARVFAFGIGNSVNRYLLDGMANAGRGEVEYVALSDDGSAAARRFAERVDAPLLTDVEIDWGGLAVTDVYPERIPDLFSAKPVVVCGRYTAPGNGLVKVRAKSGGRETVREIVANLPAESPRADVLAKLWARERIESLMRKDLEGIQNGTANAKVKEQITRLGIEYGLMTQFTSFLAVEERVVTEGGKTRRVEVPVEMPEGVDHDAAFGESRKERAYAKSSAPAGLTAGRTGPAKPTMSVAEPAPPPRTDRSSDERESSIARLSEKQIAARATYKEKAVLPDAARAAGVAGDVVVEIVVDERGKVVEARVVSGHPLLRDAALEAARKWRFRAVEVRGAKVRFAGPLTITLRR